MHSTSPPRRPPPLHLSVDVNHILRRNTMDILVGFQMQWKNTFIVQIFIGIQLFVFVRFVCIIKNDRFLVPSLVIFMKRTRSWILSFQNLSIKLIRHSLKIIVVSFTLTVNTVVSVEESARSILTRAQINSVQNVFLISYNRDCQVSCNTRNWVGRGGSIGTRSMSNRFKSWLRRFDSLSG